MPKSKAKTKAGKQRAMGKIMKQAKQGQLHSGSPDGPVVTDRKQKVAIALSESGLSRKKKK